MMGDLLRRSADVWVPQCASCFDEAEMIPLAALASMRHFAEVHAELSFVPSSFVQHRGHIR